MDKESMKAGDQQVPGQEEKEPGTGKLVMTVGLAGLLSGLALASAFVLTRPLIEKHHAEAIEKAIFKVLPGTTSFRTFILHGDSLEEMTPANSGTEKKGGEAPQLLYAGFDGQGQLTGYALMGQEPGFQDILVALIGYDARRRTVIGFEVLECKETPGLGDKIIKDAAFRKNFEALTTDPDIVFVRKGARHGSNEVEGITGATISSKAVVRLVRNTIREWKGALQRIPGNVATVADTTDKQHGNNR